ncbi:MAG: hypothetical protein ACTSYB_10520 [Candidatus Helarchaeota archaeon]
MKKILELWIFFNNRSKFIENLDLAVGSGKKVYIFEKSSPTPLWSYSAGGYIQRVAISSDGQYLVVGGYDNKVYLFDTTDTDNDGLSNGYETFNTYTNPNDWDTDDDGLSDYSEVIDYNTNPNIEDTDGDGYSDGWEVQNGYDPLNSFSNPIVRMIIIVLVVVIGISIILFYFRREISLKIHQIKSELRRKRTEKKEREKLKFDIHIKELFLRANKKIMESDLFKQSFRYLEALDKLRTATSISNQIHAFLKKKNLKGYFSESYIQEKLAKLSKLENEIISLETNCRSHILQINNWIFQIEDMEKFPGLKVILKNVLRSAPMFEIEYFLKNREIYEKWG